MNKEIKEIFEYFKKFMSAKDCAKVIMIENFITNLQEIEKDHQRINGELREQLKRTEDLAMEYKINAHDNKEICLIYKRLYEEEKDKNDKTIEYIEKNKKPLHHSWDEPDCDYWIATNPDDLLNKLKGSDK